LKTTVLRGSFLLLTSLLVQAGPVLFTGTPGDDSLATPTGPSPNLHGVLINFDGLTPFATYSTYTSNGVSISSPDGLEVLPFSTQSGPNEMFDDSAAGSANLSIMYAPGTTAIGVGIADSDANASGVPVTIDLQALNSSGIGFGTVFAVTLTETGPNPGNGYFVIQDTTPDIYGLQITQPVSNAALFSGLAIDDVQIAPEPSTFLLMGTGAAILGFFRLRKRA
jgi:PEP-CTERM motif